MDMTNEKYKGIFTALVTPMHENGEIDGNALERLVEHQIALGVNGLYVGGSTGEGLMLTVEERQSILETVVKRNAGRVSVIAHIGQISTQESIRLARHAEALGVDAISAVAPFYYKLSRDDIKRHYLSIMDAVASPMIVYHFPANTGVSLPPDFYGQLAQHSHMLGVKFTSYNLYELEQIRAGCGEGFIIMNGHDEVYAGAAVMGATGAIGSTFNIQLSLFRDMQQHIRHERWSEVGRLQAKANAIIAHMLQYDVIAYEKYMLFLQGVIPCAKVRQPLLQLAASDQAAIRQFYDNNETLQQSGLRAE